MASVVNSKLFYASPVWTSALNNHAIQKKLFSAQGGVVLRIVSAYRTVSTSAVLVLASIAPIDLLAKERKETFQLRKELTCLTNLQEIARAKGGHPQGWKVQTHLEMSDKMAWRPIREMDTPSNPGAWHLAG